MKCPRAFHNALYKNLAVNMLSVIKSVNIDARSGNEETFGIRTAFCRIKIAFCFSYLH